MRYDRLLLSAHCPSLLTPATRGAANTEQLKLDNGIVSAGFDSGGLLRITELTSQHSVFLTEEPATLTVNGEKLSVPGLELKDTKRQKESVTYTYAAGDKRFQVIYELKAGWHFVSKQFVLTLPPGSISRVEAIEMLRAQVTTPIAREHKASHGSGAVFLRLGETNPPPKFGVFLALQNPFLKWERKDRQVSMTYTPDLEWRAAYGPFASDRVCVGLYALSGVEFPARNLGEWKYVREPERAFTGFYADVSNLKPDTRHEVEITLPDNLQPGQFQGLFFENVEAAWTTELSN